jgi:hypothetical protein
MPNDGLPDTLVMIVVAFVILLVGVDINSLTGASEGDEAKASGDNQPEDSYWVLKPNGDWQALHDPTTTVTPS